MSRLAAGFGGAGAGAATGAAIRSFVPGIGTAIGAGAGGLMGAILGGEASKETETIDPIKDFKNLSWGDRVASTMSAKAEGLTQGVAGLVGLEDSVGTENEDRLSALKHKSSDHAGSSFKMGGNITGGSAGGQTSPQMGGAGVGGASPNQGISLGRALALEDEPALQQTNYNNNNFSF